METGVCRGKVSTGSQVTDEELGQQVQEAQGEACKENAGVVNKLQALDDAVRILIVARRQLAPGSVTVWTMVDRARAYLEREIEESLRS